MTTRVLLHSKDPVVCAGLQALFDAATSFELAGMASEIADIVTKATIGDFSVILLEMHPGLTINRLVELRRQLPSSRMVLWVQSMPVEIAHQVVHLGVQGILRKELPVELLLRCLEKVAQGELWYERSLSDMLLQSKEISLSPRERQLVLLIAQGFSNRQIAATLMITEGTVKVYLSKLFKKLRMRDRFELALYGLKHLHYGSSEQVESEGLYCPRSVIVQERTRVS